MSQNVEFSDKLLIIKKFKLFMINCESILQNIPKKDFIGREMFYKECSSTLELMFYTNNLKNIELKQETISRIIAKISLIDFYIERLYKLKHISFKACRKMINELNEITKMLSGWIK